MPKHNWRHLLLILIVLLVGAILLLWNRPTPQAKAERPRAPDGSPIALASPAGTIGEHLERPGGQHYDENDPALAEKLLAAAAKRQVSAAKN
ncbi:hypothetical protein [Metapseudomonas sp. CR1201]